MRTGHFAFWKMIPRSGPTARWRSKASIVRSYLPSFTVMGEWKSWASIFNSKVMSRDMKSMIFSHVTGVGVMNGPNQWRMVVLFGAGVEGLSWNQWPCTSWVKIRTFLDISITQAIARALVNRMTFFECDCKGQRRVVLPFRNWPEPFSWRKNNAAGKGDWLIPVLQNLPCSVPVHGIQSVLVLGMPHVEADLMEDALLAKIHYSRPS